MAIGLGTALAIGAIGSAAGSGTKAIIQSRAAGKAAKQQQAGAKEASGYLQQGLGQLGQLYSPYINSGAGAIGTLGRLTTPGPGARYASAGPPNAMPQPTPAPYGATGMAMPRGMLPNMGGVQGPYLMAEGGDMVVDRPTMFIAGEAGPERATFSGGPGARVAGAQAMQRNQVADPRAMGAGGGDIRSKLLAKYGGAQPMGSQRPQGVWGPQSQPMPMRGAGGWGGTFAQMGPQGPAGPPQDPRAAAMMANRGQGAAPGGPPPMDPRYEAMLANRAQGGAAGPGGAAAPQDLPWIGGGGGPQQWTPMPQNWNYY